MLTQLAARGFRNLVPLSLDPGAGTHLVLGPNGAGKTSLLEAIYLLATTRSFRTAQIGDCCRHGEVSFHLRGEVEAATRTSLEVSWADQRRQRWVNRRPTSLAEHLAVLPVIAWTSADLGILVGPPLDRRRFLDRGVVGLLPAALGSISRYRLALVEKRRWLDSGSRGKVAELETWNRVLATAAADLIRRRAAYVERLAGALKEVLGRLEIPAIEVRYRSSPRSGTQGVETILEKLAGVADRERKLGRPLIGPHRDDLEIRWDGHEIRRVASAGERKLLALALLSAHGRVLEECGRAPVYLLDDADAELDRHRLEVLWPLFSRVRQLWITSNRPEVWNSIDAHRWQCREGRLVRQ